tara:strand:+ start:1966 stop:2157 length:192 start_codon:yes stop_codon:yes gene_type:complete
MAEIYTDYIERCEPGIIYPRDASGAKVAMHRVYGGDWVPAKDYIELLEYTRKLEKLNKIDQTN